MGGRPKRPRTNQGAPRCAACLRARSCCERRSPAQRRLGLADSRAHRRSRLSSAPAGSLQADFCAGIVDTNIQNNIIVYPRSNASTIFPSPAGMLPFFTPQIYLSSYMPGSSQGIFNQRLVPARALAQNEVLRTGKTAWTGLQLLVRRPPRQSLRAMCIDRAAVCQKGNAGHRAQSQSNPRRAEPRGLPAELCALRSPSISDDSGNSELFRP